MVGRTNKDPDAEEEEALERRLGLKPGDGESGVARYNDVAAEEEALGLKPDFGVGRPMDGAVVTDPDRGRGCMGVELP